MAKIWNSSNEQMKWFYWRRFGVIIYFTSVEEGCQIYWRKDKITCRHVWEEFQFGGHSFVRFIYIRRVWSIFVTWIIFEVSKSDKTSGVSPRLNKSNVVATTGTKIVFSWSSTFLVSIIIRSKGSNKVGKNHFDYEIKW